MNKRLVMGGIILLLLVGGGVFLFVWQPPAEQEEYATTPTQWSQAGDYKIEQTPTGTLVTNEKAGFSFKVPDGWQVAKREVGKKYWLTLLSPDTKLSESNTFLNGCGINIGLIQQAAEVENIKTLISVLENNPQQSIESQRVVSISGVKALRTENSPQGQDMLEKLGESVIVYLPLDNEKIVESSTQFFVQYREECTQHFEKFLGALSIK